MAIFKKRPKPTKLMSLDELDPMVASGKPVLLDFMQVNCGPCRVMDGIVNELAEEYSESAHIVKVDVTKVTGAAQLFGVRSTPTFVLLGTAPVKNSKKARRAAGNGADESKKIGQRWRASGLVKKDQLTRVLESNGASRISA
jgi:thiol-disulfide isomerase/thioredoxin